MSKTNLILLACSFLSIGLRADVVETSDGSRVVGQLTKVDAGEVYISTVLLGDLKIPQSQVVDIFTSHPVSVRLTSGTCLEGALTGQNRAERVAGPRGVVRTSISQFAQVWPVDEPDPALGRWTYEATVDINGTTGNQSQLGTAFGYSAKWFGPDDKLDLFAAYNRQVANGGASANQFKAGADYTRALFDGTSWFARDDFGFDRIMKITFYETAATGIGQNLIETGLETLTARAGLAYRFDSYSNGVIPEVNSVAADFELNNDLKMGGWELVDKIAYLPLLSDFHQYIISQDSYFQIPLKSPAWKLRIGLANSFNDRPPPGVKKLDTTYYTRLILDWGD